MRLSSFIGLRGGHGRPLFFKGHDMPKKSKTEILEESIVELVKANKKLVKENKEMKATIAEVYAAILKVTGGNLGQ